MSYYSISAILTSAQKVPCTFDLPIPNLGFLDDNPGGDVRPSSFQLLPRLYLIFHHHHHHHHLSYSSPSPPLPYSLSHLIQSINSQSQQIAAHTPLPLPLYLAELLAVQQLDNKPLLTLDLPSSLQPRVLNALQADAKSVDLRGLEVYFFEGAARVLELLEEELLGDVLCEVCVFSWVGGLGFWKRGGIWGGG